MASLIRPLLRSNTASVAGRASSSHRLPRSLACLHTTPTLDPTSAPASASVPAAKRARADPLAAFSALNLDGTAQEFSLREHQVHVKLSHLHPSTKTTKAALYVPLSSHVFGIKPRRDILHSAVVYYLDAQRLGTASTKTRSEVSFGGKKIRPQKGSGQARMGKRNNPLLRKGGVVHGPKPRDMSSKLPRRVRELALRSALSARWHAGDLFIIEKFHWDPPPRITGPLRKMLGSKGWDDALFLTAPRNPAFTGRTARPSANEPVYTEEAIAQHAKDVENFTLALKNIPRTELIELHELGAEERTVKPKKDKKKPAELHAYEILHRRKLVMDLGAVEWVEEYLGGAVWHEDAQMFADMQDLIEAQGEERQALESEADELVQGAAPIDVAATPAPAPVV